MAWRWSVYDHGGAMADDMPGCYLNVFLSTNIMPQAILVLTNVTDADLAQALATSLLEQGLAACVNILPAVHSIYRWQGKITHATEITLMIKSTAGRYPELEAAIRCMHPYEVAEIIAIDISAGLPAYLNWIAAETVKALNV